MVVYSKEHFKVYRDGRSGYKIHNTKYPMRMAHTHIKKLHVCKTIIHNVINEEIPKTRSLYLLESHIRISDSKKYIETIELIRKKIKNKQNYYNVQNGRKK